MCFVATTIVIIYANELIDKGTYIDTRNIQVTKLK